MVTRLLRQATADAVDTERFNIYEDFHLESARNAKDILTRFDEFVVQLLCEFEDHPALLQVMNKCFF